MGLIQRFKDATRRQKAQQIRQEISNRLVTSPLCSDYENVFAQVQPLINDMKMIRPFGVGRNGGALPMSRTPELALLNTPNDEMGWGEFAGAMFSTWLTKDELNIHVHFNGRKVAGYSIVPPGCKQYMGNGDYYFQVNTGDGYITLSRDEVMTLRFSRSPEDLQKGVSPATAVRAWAQAEDVLAQYERAYIENGAIPASITFIRASTQDKFNEARRELETNLRGAKNHGKTIYVWRQFNNDTGESLDQVEVKTIQGNNSTLAIKELTDIINDHLNKAFGVSNFILGDDSSAKYDNAELSDYQFIRRRVFPALTAFWDQFQFELDRVTGGLGYAIQFEIEMPDLTERRKVQAETAKIRVESLRLLLEAGAPPLATVEALGLDEKWRPVARGISSRVLVGTDKQTSKKNHESYLHSALTRQTVNSQDGNEYCSPNNVKLQPTSTVDALPEMDADEKHIYDVLVSMAERIFANSPNIQIDEVIGEISETLNRRAELGAIDGGEKVASLLQDEAVVTELKNDLSNIQISQGLKDRILNRTDDLVNNYGEETRRIMDETLASVEGKSAGEIRKALREAMPTWQAERIARTETVYAYKSGRLDEDERINDKYGLKMKLIWRARHDSKTCDVCAAMDGVETVVGEAFTDSLDLTAGTKLINGNVLEDDAPISWVKSHWNDEGKIPAPHPNCRCYFDEVVEAE